MRETFRSALKDLELEKARAETAKEQARAEKARAEKEKETERAEKEQERAEKWKLSFQLMERNRAYLKLKGAFNVRGAIGRWTFVEGEAVNVGNPAP